MQDLRDADLLAAREPAADPPRRLGRAGDVRRLQARRDRGGARHRARGAARRRHRRPAGATRTPSLRPKRRPPKPRRADRRADPSLAGRSEPRFRVGCRTRTESADGRLFVLAGAARNTEGAGRSDVRIALVVVPGIAACLFEAPCRFASLGLTGSAGRRRESTWATPSRADRAGAANMPAVAGRACAEGDVGKTCPSGGQCQSVFCRTDASAMTMYRRAASRATPDATPDHDLTASGCDVACRRHRAPCAIAFVLQRAGGVRSSSPTARRPIGRCGSPTLPAPRPIASAAVHRWRRWCVL